MQRPKHFLFHILQRDKQAHPMPPQRAANLLRILRKVLETQANKEKGEA